MRSDISSYRRLWCAVIIQAIADIEIECRERWMANKQREKEKRSTREVVTQFPPAPASRWMDSDEIAPHTFLWICDVCDLDAHKIRKLSQSIEGRRMLLKSSMRPQNGRIEDEQGSDSEGGN